MNHREYLKDRISTAINDLEPMQADDTDYEKVSWMFSVVRRMETENGVKPFRYCRILETRCDQYLNDCTSCFIGKTYLSMYGIKE